MALCENHVRGTALVQIAAIHSVKGSEFSGTVVIYHEFNGKLLSTPGIKLALTYKQLLNLLYVGIIRAKKTLRFSSSTWQYMETLGIYERATDNEHPDCSESLHDTPRRCMINCNY